MIATLHLPAAQLCLFALGCLLIQAARAHAAVLTRRLVVTAAILAVLLLLAASLDDASDDPLGLDGISIHGAV